MSRPLHHHRRTTHPLHPMRYPSRTMAPRFPYTTTRLLCYNASCLVLFHPS